MQGIISSYDSISKSGRIQAEDGRIYAFDNKSFAKDEDRLLATLGMKVFFNVGTKNFCDDLELVDVDEFNADKDKYEELDTFLFIEGNVIDGYEIVDKGKYYVVKSDRKIEHAKYRLQTECQALGANAVIMFKDKEILKNSMGYAFVHHHVHGVPAVVARRSDKGELTRRELSKKLNHRRIEKLGKMVENTAVAKIVIKIISAILLIIFCIGFYFAK